MLGAPPSLAMPLSHVRSKVTLAPHWRYQLGKVSNPVLDAIAITERNTGTQSAINLDFERHNMFLNNNELTTLLHSTATTSLLPRHRRHARHQRAALKRRAKPISTCPSVSFEPSVSFQLDFETLPVAPPTTSPSVSGPALNKNSAFFPTPIATPPTHSPPSSPNLTALSTTCLHTT